MVLPTFANILAFVVFPYESYIRWVGAGGATPSWADRKQQLARREFSFTLADDVYLRYLSFSSAEDLKAEMLRLLPRKIDLGAVYNQKPTEHQKLGILPVEKELVFDIDMTDYDDVRYW